MDNNSLFRKNIEQGLGTLEDLYSLGEPSLYPLIERLHFHFHELENQRKSEITAVQTPPEKKNFHNLNKLFFNEVRSHVKDLFRHCPAGAKVDLINALETPSLSQLDDIVTTFPIISKATRLFQFEGNIRVMLYNDCFSIQGDIPGHLDFESLREESYALTRELFSHNVLLTFKVFESNEEGGFSIKFTCHLKESDNHGLALAINDRNLLKLSGLMENFQRPIDEIKTYGKHQVYKLTGDLKTVVVKDDEIDQVATEKDWVLFHFPFLFRPLSLIIKKKSGPKGSELTQVLTFDLFSLIQK